MDERDTKDFYPELIETYRKELWEREIVQNRRKPTRVNTYEHYPSKCNRKSISDNCVATLKRSQTRLREFNCTLQDFQLHFVSITYRLSVGKAADRPRPEEPPKKEISWSAVYHHFRKWSCDGSLKRLWKESINMIRDRLDTSNLNLDGSHAIAKKGGDGVAYQGRKRAKTSNILPITDRNGFIIASTDIIPGNHNDAWQLSAHLKSAFKSLKRLGISIAHAFFNADAAFDTRAARKICFNYRLIPNIPFNPRNRSRPKPGPKRCFHPEIYKRRFCAERTFAWIDKFRALLVRYDRRALYFMASHFIAFSLINLRLVFNPP